MATTAKPRDPRDETALVPVEERPIASLDDLRALGIEVESDGTEGILAPIPVIKLVQGTSQIPGSSQHVGQFWHSDREEYEPTITVIPLQAKYTRALFEEGGDTPVCAGQGMEAQDCRPLPNMLLWKKDRVALRDHGEFAVADTEPRACADCVFANWDYWEGKTPPCRPSKVLLVEREPGDLALLRIGATELGEFRAWVQKTLRPKRQRLPMFTQRLTVSSRERTDEAKTRKWQGLVFSSEPLPGREVVRVNQILREENARFEASLQVVHEDEEPTVATPNDGWGDGSESYAGRNAPADDGWVDPDAD